MPALIYLGGFAWGFVLIANFAGYGAGISRLLRRGPCDDGLAIAWGLSFLVVLGGALNLARLISAGLLVGLVLGGVALWVALGGVNRLVRGARKLCGLDSLVLAVLLLGYVNWLYFRIPAEPDPKIGPSSRVEKPGSGLPSHLLHDLDDPAYTLFPVRMLQTGSLGIDPFNDRLTSSSLGGSSFLQALVLAVLPFEYIHVADPGLAYLAMGVMILTMRRLSAPARLSLAVFFATYPTSAINASAIAVPVVLLVAIARLLRRPRSASLVRSSLGVALLLGALLSLKSTLIPGGVLVVFFWGCLLALMTGRVRPIVLGILVGLFTMAMLLPWMIESQGSAGTPLYPYLGEGFREHTLGSMPHRSKVAPTPLLTILFQGAIKPQRLVLLAGIVASSCCVFARRTTAAQRATLLAICGATLVNLVLLDVVVGWSSWRYTYPFAVFASLITYRTLLRLIPGSGHWRHFRTAVYLVMALFSLFYGMRAVTSSRDLPDCIAAACGGRRGFAAEEIERYRRIQSAVPPSAPFLCLMDWPLLFDSARNNFFFHDNIGHVSPPPGLSLSGPAEELADYLRSVGVHYIVGPGPRRLRAQIDEQESTIEELKAKDSNKGTENANRVQLYKLIYEMTSRYPLLYDDGRSVVIDLGRGPAPAAPALQPR